jgi:acetolactate synthase-1/2/3 large subunit
MNHPLPHPLEAGLEVATDQPRVADVVATTLHAAGIRHAFGMPGGEVVTLVDALEKVGIGFVLMRNENAAAIAAAAAGLHTGAPGLVVTTLGPGLANAVNGIADAVQERMPLIVISGVVDRGMRGRYTHQVLDQAALMRGVGVKASFEIESEGAGETVARAVRLAISPPFGPVHIDLSPGTAASPVATRQSARLGKAAVPIRLMADLGDAILNQARRLLEEAQRPLIVAGFEAARRHDGTAEALSILVMRHGIPVLTTYKAKGVVDENSPHALGAAGLSPRADRILAPLVRAADLVLLVGYDPIEMRPGWLDPFAENATVIEFHQTGIDHGMHGSTLEVIGPIAGALDALCDARRVARWSGGEPAAARLALERAFDPPVPWGPHVIVDTMLTVLPSDALVTVDSGAHRILLSQRWKAKAPLTLLQSAGWCTMGCALPLAIGAGVADSERTVVA